MTIQTVAAVQAQCRTADLDYNLAHIKELALEAVGQGAKVISLPEFFTTNIVMDDRLYSCVLPPENVALDMLKEIAMDNGVLIGGSYLEKRDGDVYNCYTLVRPDGSVTRHDKDLPTMVENAYYVGGQTDGVHKTDFGTVGTAVCWEQIRTQTIHRLKGKIDFAMTGTHWWTVATNWSLIANLLAKADKANREVFDIVPQVFGQCLGVANIHASHCGSVNGLYPMLPANLLNVAYETDLLGGTQIVDNTGKIIKHLGADAGAGVIVADIDLARGEVTHETPDQYWIHKMPRVFM